MLINDLVLELRALYPKTDFYEPALGSQLADLKSAVLPHSVSEELLCLYSTYNGADRDEAVLCISNFLSIDSALMELAFLNRLLSASHLEWPLPVVPIGEWNSSYLLAEVGAGASSISKLYSLDIGGGDTRLLLEASSLEAFFMALLNAWQTCASKKCSLTEAYEESRLHCSPDAYYVGQTGIVSTHGVVNSIDIVVE